jgi:hypothetical protein
MAVVLGNVGVVGLCRMSNLRVINPTVGFKSLHPHHTLTGNRRLGSTALRQKALRLYAKNGGSFSPDPSTTT